MLSLLSTYAVPLLGSVVLALFAKPNDKTVLQNILSVFKPGRPKPDNPEVLRLLPRLLNQLLHKTPPADDVAVEVDVKDPQDLVTHILSLLSLPENEQPKPAPVVAHGEIADLVACANAVAANNPEYDIQVVVNKSGVQVVKVKRETE